eukprot:TRINITY_DN4779_c0_g1_i2.p1 TRINITY_DN4779_c0_g1~~TRINITY_DN4779_c0_g1_i2.p1  ORF type:complete len:484 (+),score=100.06 TRINITY_DN4779_c0_g1_i2:47-1498(+)
MGVDDTALLRKITWRIVPFVGILYMICILDRVNIGSVHHSLRESLHLSEAAFGQAVGVFFLGYCLMEIPSNLMMKKSSPSIWLSRIMVSWGILTIGLVFVSDLAGLLVVRVLLGMAEAGFFPGIMFFFMFWFSRKERTVRIAGVAIFGSIANVLGGIITYLILTYLEGVLGMYGWQWVFVIEGVPSVIAGVLVWFLLPDYPETTKWLTSEEKLHILNKLKRDNDPAPSVGDPDTSIANEDINAAVTESKGVSLLLAKSSNSKKISWREVRDTLLNTQNILFSLILFCRTAPAYMLSFFMPAIIHEFGFDPILSNLLTAPVQAVAICVQWAVAYNCDRTGKHAIHLIILGFLDIIGWEVLAYSLTTKSLPFQYATLTFVTATTSSIVSPALSWLTAGLRTSTSAATGTAMAISVANVGGYVGPLLMSYSMEWYGTYAYGIASAGGLMAFFVVGVIVIYVMQRTHKKEYGGYIEVKEDTGEHFAH